MAAFTILSRNNSIQQYVGDEPILMERKSWSQTKPISAKYKSA